MKDENKREVLTELEAKFYDTENERRSVLRERDVLRERVRDLQEQCQASAVNKDLVELLKEDNQNLKENNKSLRAALEKQDGDHAEIKLVWDTELKSLREKMAQLRVRDSLNES